MATYRLHTITTWPLIRRKAREARAAHEAHEAEPEMKTGLASQLICRNPAWLWGYLIVRKPVS